ncbi:MAG: diguanylate cyclase domain-containing protein [Leptolyngbyaceae cyanobacterium]
MPATQVAALRKEILVVDDAPENLQMLLDALSEQGYSVRCARSGNLAIIGSQAIPPDLILLDILMPQMDGYEVCQRLKQDDKTCDVPIIFLSALDDGDNQARAFALGGDDYIAKPFNIVEVLARVKHQLDLRQRQLRSQQRIARYRRTSYELREAYAFIKDVLNCLPYGIAAFQSVVNEAGDVTGFKSIIANAAFWQLAHDASDAVLTDVEETLQALVADHSQLELFGVCLQAMASEESIQRELLCLNENQQQCFEVFATQLQGTVVTLLRDISDTKAQISTLETTNRELYSLATTDALTQIGNRYQFDSYFSLEWQRSLREQQPLSLIIADIDKFKQFNDVCGHSVGDRCLQAVAQAIQSAVRRPTDLVARYGGEEFAIVLPNTPLRGARQIADTIQMAIHSLHLLDAPALTCEQVRLSLGIGCTLPQEGQHSRALIEAADRALYRAKAQGGDTVCVDMI